MSRFEGRGFPGSINGWFSSDDARAWVATSIEDPLGWAGLIFFVKMGLKSKGCLCLGGYFYRWFLQQ